jgi:hypothetical protein
VQGDVRLSRGDGKHTDLNKPWELAQGGELLERGFAVATGNGRAEIEFENGSTAYLAENSLLLFTELSVPGNRIVTRMALPSGTATFSLQPTAHESFFIETPTDKLEITSPDRIFARVDSYLDGTAITPQSEKGEDLVRRGSPKLHFAEGQTLFLRGGEEIELSGTSHSMVAIGWDSWVSARAQEKETKMTAALKASGLSSPIPGLTELYAHGTFFQCEPYGTCWEATQQGPAKSPSSQASPPSAQSPAPNSPNPGFQPQVVGLKAYDWEHPCDSYSESYRTIYRVAHTPEELKELLRLKAMADLYPLGAPNPFGNNCLRQSWIRHHDSYALVLPKASHLVCGKGKKCPPVHPPHPLWVSVGGKVGFVPRHPNDVKGKPSQPEVRDHCSAGQAWRARAARRGGLIAESQNARQDTWGVSAGFPHPCAAGVCSRDSCSLDAGRYTCRFPYCLRLQVAEIHDVRSPRCRCEAQGSAGGRNRV